MKSHFDMFVLLLIFRIISKHLFIRTPMEGLLNLNGIGLAVSRRLVDMDWILCMRRSEKGSNRPMDRSSPPVGVLIKSCSENMQQFYSRTRMPKCDFNEVVYNFIEITLRHGCSPVNVLHIFGTPFLKNNSGWLLLKHVGSLMGWFNSNISHRSFIFLFKNGTLKSPNNEILSYKPW